MAEDDRNPIRVAYERRNRDLDPQLVWRGKDEQNWSDLVVQAPPLFIQEKVQPKVLIDDLRQRSKETEDGEANLQTDLFADFNGLPSADAQTEFYQHDANWSNRMILGDSLQVMASLAEREGLRGKVQCIYIDPPYGIKSYYLLADSRDGQIKEAELARKAPSEQSTYNDIRQGFVYERVPHITLKSIANNAEIDVIYEKFQETLEPLHQELNDALGNILRRMGNPPRRRRRLAREGQKNSRGLGGNSASPGKRKSPLPSPPRPTTNTSTTSPTKTTKKSASPAPSP